MAEDNYLKRMYELSELGDPEIAHSMADDVLCDIVISCGHQEVVDIFRDMLKWYS